EGRAFGTPDDVVLALESGELETLTPIRLRISGELIDLTVGRDDQGVQYAEVQNVTSKVINTTVGRVILNTALPKPMPYVNGLLKKKGLQQLVQYCYLRFGLEKTVDMLDSLKNLGFTYATRSGLSIGIDDLVIPSEKATLVERARDEVIKVEGQYLEGAITNGERYNKLVAVAQDVIIHEIDCGTMDGIDARAIVESGEIIEPLRDRIIGRVTLERIIDPFSGEVIVESNEELDEQKATDIQEAGIEKVRI